MGKFSDLVAQYVDQKADRSCIPYETQLLWRLDELYQRRDELIKIGAPYEEYSCLTQSDIHYALVEHLYSIESVDRAIELVFKDLKDKCGIIIFDKDETPPPEIDVCENQLSLFDIPQPLKAA